MLSTKANLENKNNQSNSSDQLVAPLTATLSQLSATGGNVQRPDIVLKGPFAVPKKQVPIIRVSSRKRSKSLSQVQHHPTDILTPNHKSSNGLVKPSPSAFHSTGVLSKKGNRSAAADGHKITPETPIKHKRQLGSIWGGLAGPTTGASLIRSSSGAAHVSFSETPLSKRSFNYNNSTARSTTFNTPASHISNTSRKSYIPSSDLASPFTFGNEGSVTPSVDTSVKSNRLHRSPLKETPTKTFKRPHLDTNQSPCAPGSSPSFLLSSEKVKPQFINISTDDENNMNMLPPMNVPVSSFTSQPPKQSVFSGTTMSDEFQDFSGQGINSQNPLLDKPYFDNSFSPPMQPPSKILSRREQGRDISLDSSPVVPPKDFFRVVAKERKAPVQTAHPISFSNLKSKHRQLIGGQFFQALEGIEPGLSLILSSFSKRSPEDSGAPILDWFDTHFIITRKLGQGDFAEAFHVENRDDGLYYAIKKALKPFQGYKDAVQKLSEVKMLLKVRNSPYCISLKEAWIQRGFLYIQTEVCTRGSLAMYLEQHCSVTPLSEAQIWRIFVDVVRGLVYIHEQEIVHLDIKPGNIFIEENGTLKIGDFGLATKPPVINGDREGDRTYLAPEFLTESAVSYPADIFSLGLILLEMAANIILPENGDVWQQLREGNLNGIDLKRHNRMLTDLILSMLQKPSQRPTAQNLLAHPYLQIFIS